MNETQLGVRSKQAFGRKTELHLKAIGCVMAWVLITGIAAAHEVYRAAHYNVDDGLPTNLTKTVIQDQDGFLWIAMDSGVVRYDGLRFDSFLADEKLTYAKDLIPVPDTNQVLAIGDHGLVRILRTALSDTATIEPIALHDSNGAPFTLHYPKAGFLRFNGDLWISEYNAVAMVRDGVATRYVIEDESVRTGGINRSYMFHESESGELYVFSHSGGIYRFNPSANTFQLLDDSTRDQLSSVSACLPMPDGTVWLGADTGIHSIRLGGKASSLNLTLVAEIPGVSTMLHGTGGQVLVGTWRQGLYQIHDSRSPQDFEPVETYLFPVVNELFLEQNGRNILVSSDQGLALLQPSVFETVDLPDGGYNIRVKKTRTGHLVATDGTDLYALSADTARATAISLLRPEDAILSGFAVDGDRIWVGVLGGVQIHEGGQVRKVSLEAGCNPALMSVAEDGSLWVAPRDLPGLFRVSPGGAVETFNEENGLASPVTAMLRRSDGSLVVATKPTAQGSLFIHQGASDQFRSLSPIGSEKDIEIATGLVIQDLAEDGDGAFMLATNDGLMRWTNGKFSRPPGTEALKQQALTALTAHPRGGWWIGSNRGLSLLEQDQLIGFDKEEGLRDPSINQGSLHYDERGELWVGTAGGLSLSHSTQSKILRTPRPLPRGVQVNGKATRFPAGPLEVPHNADVTLSVVSLAFPGDQIHYRKRILGLSDEWVAVSTPFQVTALRLPEGDFTLQVQAQQRGQFWSPVLELPIEVSPPWYLSAYAYTGYLLLVAFLGYLFLAIRRSSRRSQEAERALQESNERHHLIANAANDGMWDWNLEEDEIFFSPRWYENLGLKPSEVSAAPEEFFDRVHEADLPDLLDEIAQFRQGHKKELVFEHRMRCQDGEDRWFLTRTAAQRRADGVARRIVGWQTDITERKAMEEQLRHASLYDSLTGLPNRYLFSDRLDRMMLRLTRDEDYRFSLVYMDLDKFKDVNDTHGHVMGDLLLQAVGKRLEQCIRRGDTVARLGGDEFAILFDNVSEPESITRLVHRIRDTVEQPLALADLALVPQISIGVATIRGQGDTIKDLMARADKAMYAAKRNPLTFYSRSNGGAA